MAPLTSYARGGPAFLSGLARVAGLVYCSSVPIKLRYIRCDVFTERALEGNPLVVFTDARRLDQRTMQAIAREMNLSETAFVLPREGAGHARLRIFTPEVELPFAGHPVLGAAFVLATPMQSDYINIETGQGVIAVHVERAGQDPSFAWMQVPAPKLTPLEQSSLVYEALGLEPGPALERFEVGVCHTLVDVGSRQKLTALVPDFQRLKALGPLGCVAYAADGCEAQVRVFVPGAGINEDPATGSAAGPLFVELNRRGRLKPGDPLTISQGAELGRPSELHVQGQLDGDNWQLSVGGAVRVLGRGELLIPTPQAAV